MLIFLVLGAHLLLVATVTVAFVYRYFLAFKNKEYPKIGLKLVFGSSLGLVITGTLLAVIGKLPITKVCLQSLGLIVGLLAVELILQKVANKLASDKTK